MAGRTLVVCIGNALVADDGLGQAVYEELQGRSRPPELRLVSLGMAGVDLLDIVEGEELLIVVDAIQLGGPPGSIRVMPWTDIPAAALRPVSGHGIGIKEAILIGRKLYAERMPADAVLIGVEGVCFDRLGGGLSPPVAAAVPAVADTVLRYGRGRR